MGTSRDGKREHRSRFPHHAPGGAAQSRTLFSFVESVLGSGQDETVTSPDIKRQTPRERAHVELTRQIKQVALRQLGETGAAALSLRGVARELGLGSASALYRYFPGRNALLTALIIDSYTALGAAAQDAERRVHDGSILTRWMAICHAVRDWAVANTHEYALIFGTPIPGYAAPPDTTAPGTMVPTLMIGLLAELFITDPPDGPREPVPDQVRRSAWPVLSQLPPEVPEQFAVRGVMAWTYLFGAVSFEVFGHRRQIITDPEPFFDYEIRQMARTLGLTDQTSP
jgi:AcrR family transcriptional regulator